MKTGANGTGFKWILAVALFVALFTGFGNMPLYGRYYIADLPGFGWAGNFIVNLKVHLVTGALLLALALYWLAGFIRLNRKWSGLSGIMKLTVACIALSLFSGLLAGLKNFAFLTPGLALNMIINFFHMGMAMLVAMVGVIALSLSRKPAPRKESVEPG